VTASHGTVTKTPNKASYSASESVTLLATPKAGYEFTGWSGALSGNTNPATVIMTGDKSIVANFAAQAHTLTISAVNGSVTRNPNKTSYQHGEVVTLQAVANPGYTFTGWSGDASGTNSTITVTMNSDKAVTAGFTANVYTLSVTSVNGSVTRNPNKTTYAHGETVALTAVPNTGYTFTGWSGAITGSTNPATVVMDSNKSVTAGFTYSGSSTGVYRIYITTAKNGRIIKTPDKQLYARGEQVILEAVPDQGYVFTRWQNYVNGATANPITITMNSSRWVGAHFSRARGTTGYTLTFTAHGGTVTRTPNKTSYVLGETVTLQATPATGYAFTGWSGALSGATNPASLVMNSNKSVTARFAPVNGGGTVQTAGNTTVFSSISVAANRRAVPYTMPKTGQLQSISMYHQGGSGRMLLGVYADSPGRPGTRLGVTRSTTVNRNEGWQTIALSKAVSVSAGRKIWLAWVYENCPGIRCTEGAPGHAESRAAWSGGMPSVFGSMTPDDYLYSIYATYR
jgi:uncharacterized repeat protein (TIGR02543 family)